MEMKLVSNLLASGRNLQFIRIDCNEWIDVNKIVFSLSQTWNMIQCAENNGEKKGKKTLIWKVSSANYVNKCEWMHELAW